MSSKIKRFTFNLSPFQSKSIKAMLDAFIIFCAFGIGTILQQGTIHVEFLPLLGEMIAFTAITILVFLVCRVYRAIWAYISLTDLFYLAFISVLTIGVYFGIRELVFIELGLPHINFSQPLITGMVMLGGVASLRILYRIAHFGGLGGKSKRKNKTKILLVGAGDDAEIFIRSIINNPNAAYEIVGLLDPSDARSGRTIHSIPVLGKPDDIHDIFELLKKKNKTPQRIVFTTTKETKNIPVDVLINEAEVLGLKFARLPSLTEFRDGDIVAQQLKPIAIEDLIGRPQTVVDFATIKGLITNKRILITGAGGSIGHELSMQIASFGPSKMLLLDNSEFNLYSIDLDVRNEFGSLDVQANIADIRNGQKIHRLFKEFKPDVVFHAAALKHVPLVEMNPCEGIHTNVIGTQNVADAAKAVKAEAFVQISTDKAVNPTNIMGASKRIGEYYAQALDLEKSKTRFITVRFGNVLGSSGSVVPLFKKQLKMGGPITVTHPDIKRYFMTIKEAVGLVLQASASAITQNSGERGYIFVLDMKEPLKIMDVARQMIRLANLVPDEDIKIKITGLRPGEKLYEELFDEGETLLKTDIPSTFAANPAPLKLTTLKTKIKKLNEAVIGDNVSEIIKILTHTVPGFNHESNK